MNESVTVRSEESAIYTRGRNLIVQIYVGTANVDLETADVNRKHCSRKVKEHCAKVNVGTSDLCWDC
jgi:hypothetical protein